jgi:dipeptidyl aminopeptidase/acylaminoacyl peptidase
MSLLVHLALVASLVCGAEATVSQTFQAKDTLAVAPDSNRDAQDCLDCLIWKPGEFAVTCKVPEHALPLQLVRFPSPRPSGNAANDLVALEWYAACDEEGRVTRAPAVLVIHESGAGMQAGRLFARGLQAYGLHAFMIHLPYYGERRTQGVDWERVDFRAAVFQSIADVRRARDAIAVLPYVDASRIGVQGTSLGGFVTALAASLDHGFSSVFVMLAGGDLADVIRNGKQDTAKLRESLAKAGYTDDKLKEVLRAIEPTRIAHRLDARRTWIYSGELDRVVPIQNAEALARAAKLDDAHHVRVAADHYSAILYFPRIVKEVAEHLKAVPD